MCHISVPTHIFYLFVVLSKQGKESSALIQIYFVLAKMSCANITSILNWFEGSTINKIGFQVRPLTLRLLMAKSKSGLSDVLWVLGWREPTAQPLKVSNSRERRKDGECLVRRKLLKHIFYHTFFQKYLSKVT